VDRRVFYPICICADDRSVFYCSIGPCQCRSTREPQSRLLAIEDRMLFQCHSRRRAAAATVLRRALPQSDARKNKQTHWAKRVQLELYITGIHGYTEDRESFLGTCCCVTKITVSTFLFFRVEEPEKNSPRAAAKKSHWGSFESGTLLLIVSVVHILHSRQSSQSHHLLSPSCCILNHIYIYILHISYIYVFANHRTDTTPQRACLSPPPKSVRPVDFVLVGRLSSTNPHLPDRTRPIAHSPQ
jgi:hypothetical protein